MIKIGENTLAEFHDTHIVWEVEIVSILGTNRAIKRVSARQQNENDNATRCYICRHEYVESEAKGPKDRDHYPSRADLLATPTASVTWSPRSASRFQCSFITSVATMRT